MGRKDAAQSSGRKVGEEEKKLGEEPEKRRQRPASQEAAIPAGQEAPSARLNPCTCKSAAVAVATLVVLLLAVDYLVPYDSGPSAESEVAKRWCGPNLALSLSDLASPIC